MYNKYYMTSGNGIPTTISELLIVGIVIFYGKIHDLLLFIVTHEFFHNLLLNLKDIMGFIVAVLGAYLMILKIKKVKKQNKELDKKE